MVCNTGTVIAKVIKLVKMAKRWEKETPKEKKLPSKMRKRKRK
jgi:hypothetical protein